MRYFSFIFLLCIFTKSTRAQCPPNIDFENGNMGSGWEFFIGQIAYYTGDPASLAPHFDEPGKFWLLSNDIYNGIDDIGHFPRLCPNGSGHSVFLDGIGESLGGGGAPPKPSQIILAMFYTFTVPDDHFFLNYNYAASTTITQNPSNPPAANAFGINVQVLDISEGSFIPCASVSYAAGEYHNIGFVAPDLNHQDKFAIPWRANSVDLSGKQGHRIRISFMTIGSYLYFDISSPCNNSFFTPPYCAGGDTYLNLTAPYGYTTYDWFDPAGNPAGNTQTITLTPPPPPNSVYTVHLENIWPHSIGCPVTMTTTVHTVPAVTANAGPRDTIQCSKTPVKIGAPPVPGVTYSWSPAAGLTNPNISNPSADITATTTYVLTVKSIGGGCIDRDTITVTRQYLNNQVTVTGGGTDCMHPAPTVLHVNHQDSVQWYNGSNPIAGETGDSLIILQSGYYHAVVFSSAGCSLNTSMITVTAYPIAEAAFKVNNDLQCFADNEFIFTDTSHYAGPGLHYHWDFGDGRSANTKDATHTYNTSGTFTVTFRVWADNGCTDTRTKEVTVKPGARANFSVEATCVNLPVSLMNKTLSPGANVVNYLWEFSNGFTSTAFEPPYTFTAAGTYHIKLTTGTPQCPLPSIKEIDLLIDLPKVPVRSEQTAMINFPQKLSVRSFAVRAMWTPAINLNDAYSLKPVFRGFGSQLYSVKLTSATHCVTVDTVFVKVIKQISIFVPTAFTPNGDGINDYLKPLLYGFKKINWFRIYNRWGKLIFQSEDDLKGWDGKISEIPQDTQTFVWIISAVDVDGVTHVEKGTTSIVR